VLSRNIKMFVQNSVKFLPTNYPREGPYLATVHQARQAVCLTRCAVVIHRTVCKEQTLYYWTDHRSYV